MKKVFYTYKLVDPRDNKIFYIGKGTNGRLNCHEMEARKNVQSPKCQRIREIWSENLQIIKQKICVFENEKDAYEHESFLINEIGLENLTNLMPGGGGCISGEVIVDYMNLVKKYKKDFVAWLKLTNGGRYKIEAECQPSNNFWRELFTFGMNEFYPRIWENVISNPKNNVKLKNMFSPHQIYLEFI